MASNHKRNQGSDGFNPDPHHDGRSLGGMASDHRDSGKEPTKLHVNQPAAVGEELLGSQEWTRLFASYLDQKRVREEWWKYPYLMECVHHRLGDKAIWFVLAWLRDGGDYHVLSRQARQGDYWLGRKADLAERVVDKLFKYTAA